ncbi:hypothetical protein QR680_013682 [Steinernema hermaphroditum]|uniref:Tyrosine-protein phosphatase domain-containing protein n=1 Tax=Steinernema hermaphroditum TaxID=289476 RepID=A0AA39M2S4_9BILA|nr:hypothetical protein QR680_013682 [Steinernema hermaphroditum]
MAFGLQAALSKIMDKLDKKPELDEEKKEEKKEERKEEKKEDKVTKRENDAKPKEEVSKRRRKEKKTPKGDKAADKEREKRMKATLPKAANSQEEINKWANKTLDKGIRGLQEDFQKMKSFVPERNDAVAFGLPANKVKNRYNDIVCLDSSRVKINNFGPDNEYIHANYVSTAFATHRFICCQGPMDNTMVDFWRMVVQEEAQVILMLCNVVEAKQKKCAEYYPTKLHQPATFGEVTVKAVKQTTLADEPSVEITLLQVKSGSTKLMLKHYHWVDWPDKGVPEVSLTITNMLTSVRGSKKPIIVHCSAGIGRTGTVVCVEFLLERMTYGQSCEDTVEVLKDLRRQRAASVQTEIQYLYIHRIMLHYFIQRKSIDMSQRLLEFIDDYDYALKKAIEQENQKKAAKAAAAAAAAAAGTPPQAPTIAGTPPAVTPEKESYASTAVEGYFHVPTSTKMRVNETQWMSPPP